VDLISKKNGGYALGCSDQFFAPASNLLEKGRGIFIPDRYTDKGKWMDGWETRRHNKKGFDWCIIRMGLSGCVKGFCIDTNHFTGNYAPQAKVEALCDDSNPSVDKLASSQEWVEILSKVNLKGSSEHFFEIPVTKRMTHIRLTMFPDGGISRFRVHGLVTPNWKNKEVNEVIDLALVNNGGRSVGCSDKFYSSPQNLLVPGRGFNMGDGWETKRSRVPNHKDWAVIKLGAPSSHLIRTEIDTCHFKGNFPDFCILEGASIQGKEWDEKDEKTVWYPLFKDGTQVPLTAHYIHPFDLFHPENLSTPITHVRLTVFPDGGVSRLRDFGLRHDFKNEKNKL